MRKGVLFAAVAALALVTSLGFTTPAKAWCNNPLACMVMQALRRPIPYYRPAPMYRPMVRRVGPRCIVRYANGVLREVIRGRWCDAYGHDVLTLRGYQAPMQRPIINGGGYRTFYTTWNGLSRY